MSAQPIPLKVRRLCWARSGYVCEACSAARAVLLHHRKLRSQGGLHEPSNLLHICNECHARIHAGGAESYERGLLVYRVGVPAMTPVSRYVDTPS